MHSTTVKSIEPVSRPEQTKIGRQIRGSSLLFSGQMLAKGVNFAVQVLIVRYLSQTSYGAFAYALSIVSLVQIFISFGLDLAITRFVPIYHEKGDYNKLFGTIMMVIGTILSLGLASILLLYGLQGFIAQQLISDQQALSLLLLLIFLAPVQAIDSMLIGLFAVFASPRAIFFRKYVLAPGLKLAVVLLLIMGQSTVYFLAVGYLLAGTLGVVIYLVIFYRLMRDQGYLTHFNISTINVPWREVLSFTIPLLTTELVYIVMNSMDVVLLEHFRDVTSVAILRAVQPTALMNQLVMTSFATLFTPLAARMFAQRDNHGINNLYWQTAIWIAVFSFPIFALTFSLAQPITTLLYGERYEQSAIILAILSLGYYFNAALGLNGLTLKIYGKLRYIVTLNILTAVANLGVNLLLIPRYGAVGAAVGTCGTLITYNIFKQTGLRLGAGINFFERRYFRVYLIITLSALGLLFVQWITASPIYLTVILAGIGTLLVFWFNRKLLDIRQTFPEINNIPLIGRILNI